MKHEIDISFYTALVILASAGIIAVSVALGLKAIALAITGAG